MGMSHAHLHTVRARSCDSSQSADGGRKGAIEALYGGEPRDALARKLRVARHAFSWKPLVRSSYPWNEWLDGQPRVLAKGVDYDAPRRLWESGRKVAAARGIRLVLVDRGDSLELLAGAGTGTIWRRADPDG
jgi:hypothetical protein